MDCCLKKGFVCLSFAAERKKKKKCPRGIKRTGPPGAKNGTGPIHEERKDFPRNPPERAPPHLTKGRKPSSNLKDHGDALGSQTRSGLSQPRHLTDRDLGGTLRVPAGIQMFAWSRFWCNAGAGKAKGGDGHQS